MTIDEISKHIYIKDSEVSPAIGKKGIISLFKNDPKPDAVFCCNDSTVMKAIKEIQKRHLIVPDDIAVTGFNGFPNSLYCNPRLTIVKVPKFSLGKEAFYWLNEVIQHPLDPPQTRIITTEFIKRDGTNNKKRKNRKNNLNGK